MSRQKGSVPTFHFTLMSVRALLREGGDARRQSGNALQHKTVVWLIIPSDSLASRLVGSPPCAPDQGSGPIQHHSLFPLCTEHYKSQGFLIWPRLWILNEDYIH